MNLAIYARVSTDDQNIGQQQAMLIEYCQKNGHTYRSYLDDGVSGEIEDRPAWQKLMRNAKAFEGILVVKWDRITRSLKYAITFLDWLEAQDLKLLSLYDGEFDFSPDKVFQFKLKCLLSEYELQQLRWRSRIGIERAKREGKYKGGKKGRTWKNETNLR